MLRLANTCACRPCCAVRTAKFVARKQWMVCGADDMFVRVYNYNTMDKVKHLRRTPTTSGALGRRPSLLAILQLHALRTMRHSRLHLHRCTAGRCLLSAAGDWKAVPAEVL